MQLALRLHDRPLGCPLQASLHWLKPLCLFPGKQRPGRARLNGQRPAPRAVARSHQLGPPEQRYQQLHMQLALASAHMLPALLGIAVSCCSADNAHKGIHRWRGQHVEQRATKHSAKCLHAGRQRGRGSEQGLPRRKRGAAALLRGHSETRSNQPKHAASPAYRTPSLRHNGAYCAGSRSSTGNWTAHQPTLHSSARGHAQHAGRAVHLHCGVFRRQQLLQPPLRLLKRHGLLPEAQRIHLYQAQVQQCLERQPLHR